MKVTFEPGKCILVSCPQCEEWIDADSDSCQCGWNITDYEDEYDDEEYSEEE